MSQLKFGTSGLRGLVSDLTDEVCAAYAAAFLAHMQAASPAGDMRRLLVGYDLRPSSPRIAAACAAAARTRGVEAVSCGALPTPALALAAMTQRTPAVMVTGSHIPADRNGLKFYRPDGEIDKADEAAILARLEADPVAPERAIDEPGPEGAVSPAALDAYAERCRTLAPPGLLAGKRIGIYQHSSVGRDLLAETIDYAGATAVPLARSETFIPVDTEALRPEDEALALSLVAEHGLDALVSADGDADRPLIADETGRVLRGDTIGLLTARELGADAVVTPVTSNSAAELCGAFARVMRTRVGSPYVIAGMHEAAAQGAKRVVGYEANGGVLLGTPLTLQGSTIATLPTRDAMLPILAVLTLAARRALPLSALEKELPQRFTRSGRLEHVAGSASGPFLDALAAPAKRAAFFAPLGPVSGGDAIDGVRTIIAGGDVLHYRASGNAPELRCYAEAATPERADALLAWGLDAARSRLEDRTV